LAYDGDFYSAYRAYLLEPGVRSVHDKAIGMTASSPAFRRVLDLGCGQGNEFLHYGKPHAYVGVDLNALPVTSPHATLAADYRDLAMVTALIASLSLTAVVSLFSTECTAPWRHNHAFYEALFRSTAIEAMLVSGFYYADQPHAETVGEAGGIVSYQSIQPLEASDSSLFTEVRVSARCPSSLFGETPIEVWRLLQRR
jgi:SAM-dependent methyltransferase